MLKRFKRNILKMFREFLVYHNSSMEFRAKILTLMIASDSEINPCEHQMLAEVASKIYSDDSERADILIDTVNEYFQKIKTKNGLDFEHLIVLVEREARDNKRFSDKIDIEVLKRFSDCLDKEEDKIFHQRILEFLEGIKEEYGAV
ncbi:MAG: hypothetical protein U9R27_01540 [Campylobacterota bacterium]|nr:hypothetical protein [Campylobacterota bacterium]